MSEPSDKALQNARSTADAVQMRIIKEKLAQGKKLFLDEQALLERLNPLVQAETETRFGVLKNLAERMRELFNERRTRAREYPEETFSIIEDSLLNFYTESDEALETRERILAFEMATGRKTDEEVISMISENKV